MFAELREQLAAEQFVGIKLGQKTFSPQHQYIIVYMKKTCNEKTQYRGKQVGETGFSFDSFTL